MRPTDEEIAAIVAACEALRSAAEADVTAPVPHSGWRAAGRRYDAYDDFERARRRAAAPR